MSTNNENPALVTEETGVETTETVNENTPATEVLESLEAEATEEAPKIEEKPKESEEDRKFAAKFAALSRREKAAKQLEVKLSKEKAALEARIKELENKAAAPAEKKASDEPLDVRLKKNPFKTLEEMGLSYETLTRMALNDGKATPEIEMELMKQELRSEYQREIAEMKARLEERDNKEKESTKQSEEKRQQELLQSFKDDLAAQIEANKETYELLAVEGEYGVEAVYNLIAEDAAQKKQEAEEMGDDPTQIELLSFEEAANKVEEQLLSEAKKRIELSKIKKLMASTDSQTKKETTTQKPPSKPASVTLSNEKAQVQGSTRAFQSDEESKRQAAKLIRWE